MGLGVEQQRVVDFYRKGLRNFQLAEATDYSPPGAYHIITRVLENRSPLITPLDKLKENLYNRVGVFVVIVNDREEILLCREKGNDKETGKKANQWGIIGEKSKVGETLKHTVVGGIVEELGEPILSRLSTVEEQTYFGEIRPPWTRACGRIFALNYHGEEPIVLPPESEIQETKWVSVEEALAMDGNLRPGMKEVLERVQPAIPKIVSGQSLRLNHYELSKVKERSSKPDIKW